MEPKRRTTTSSAFKQIPTLTFSTRRRARSPTKLSILALNYEGLTRQDNDLNTVPAAAESWEFNEDATQITFTLRDGLTYSDGSPLTAERFRYAVERNCDPNTAGEYQSILFEIVGWPGLR